MHRSSGALAVAACALLCAAARPAGAAPPRAWLVSPEDGMVVAREYASGRLGPSVAIAAAALPLPPSVAIGPDGLPAAAWIDTDGHIRFSAHDGRRWSPPELVAGDAGGHRGAPSLALVAGRAVVAWAEAADGGFEDILYAVRDGGRWGAPERAHDPNDAPDILPSVAADPEGGFDIRWRRLDGDRYVERRMGEGASARREAPVPPDDLIEEAVEAALPAGTALAWEDADGTAGSALLGELIGDGPGEDDRGDGERSAGGEIDIIAFGDSITWGRGSSANGPRTGYPVYLQAILTHNHPAFSFRVFNEGVPGERTDTGLQRIDAVLARYPAQAILIMEGTNDIFYGISPRTIQENLRQMAFRARARGVVPVLATLIPTDPRMRPEQYARTRSFYLGNYIQELHARHQILYADQWREFCSVPNFGETLFCHNAGGGNHPNDNGYRYVMAPAWYETVAPLIPIPFEPVPPQIDLDESDESVARGAREDFGYVLAPSNDLVLNAVDVYVALRPPTGGLLYRDAAGRWTARPAPAAPKVLLNTVDPAGYLFGLPITGDAPLGTYTLYAVAVRCLRYPLNAESWTSNLAEISFAVREW
ncbi:MAG: GDSL-type esterase/lipase family protein [bacterium]|nr:GDSL-type esterase/lipase family protein [bacterium]